MLRNRGTGREAEEVGVSGRKGLELVGPGLAPWLPHALGHELHQVIKPLRASVCSSVK